MEFWGVEVKPGVPHKVTFKEDRLLHLSQAALGETKKANDNVVLFVSFEGNKLALGTLSSDKCPQMTYDLIFEKGFELSHNSKNGSVYFTGYKSKIGSDSPPSDDSEDSDSEGEFLLVENGKPEPLQDVKVSSSAAKPKVKIVEPKMDDESEDNDSEDSSDEGESDEEDNTGASDGTDDDDDSDDDEDDSDDEDEDTQDNSKKRPAETSASKTPADKKAKLSTPQKSGAGGKQGNRGHAATPHPAKKAGKSDKSKQETPKSAATPVSCKTCSKTFNSEKGLESHTKAKHSN